jgi:uncharacterized membrane protein YhaH (DUF805 family)
MSFTQAVRSGFANYVNFSGRATRSEFWWWQLFTLLVAFVAGMIDGAVGLNSDTIPYLWALVTLLPGLAVSVRRLHDIDMSGWWLFIIMIPLVGFVLLFVWFIRDGTPGYNRFGANPKPKEVSLHAQGRSLHRARTDKEAGEAPDRDPK